jgi:hypothetical protein
LTEIKKAWFIYISSVLQVALAPEVSSVGFEALSKLNHLRQFLFGDYNESMELEQKCLLLCALFLPKLQISGFDFTEPCLQTFHLLVDGDLRYFYHDQVVQLPIKIGLEQLVVSGNVQIHKNFQLPELRTLYLCRLIDENENVAGMLDRFSTISELGLFKLETDTVIKVLQLVGRKLRKLAMGELQGLLLLKILQLCPSLRHLQITLCKFDDLDTVWPVEFFSCLEEVVLQMQFNPLPSSFTVQVKIVCTQSQIEIIFLV